jgi:hypothetical protein
LTSALLLAASFALPLSPFLRFHLAAGGTCEASGSCYVTPTGAGAKTGTDWNDAYADLPASLTRGVTYFLAGSATSYAMHRFNDANSGTTAITIYKAVDCSLTPTAPYCGTINPASVAGWQASFGTTAAAWIDTALPDPETSTGSNWQFCSDYYKIDGVTGSTSPANPGDQGFVVGTQNKKTNGIINLGNQGCTSSPSGLTNLSFSHLNVGGVGRMPYFPVSVTSCTYAGTSATIGTASSLSGIVGDTIAGWTNANAILFNGVAASSISSTQVVVPLATSPCATLAGLALDFSPADAFFAFNHANGAETFTNLTIQNSYVHDVSETIEIYNGYNVNILHNYLARNRSTPTQHSSIVQFSEGSPSTVSGPATVAYNFVLDATGTGVIEHLGEPTGCNSNCGTINGFYVYGNIFTCDKAPLTLCGVGQATVSDNAGENNVQNALFYNNTVADGAGPGGLYLLSARSTGGVAENNLYYNLGTTNSVKMQGPNGFVHAYNTLLNSVEAYGTAPCTANETCIPSGAADPFVNDAGLDFRLAAPMNAASNSRKVAAQGLSLPSPYDLDFEGLVRGADGTWARGAYEFSRIHLITVH